MILFCEECGTRHDIAQGQLGNSSYQFVCTVCRETLLVSFSSRQGKKVQAAMQQDDAVPTRDVSDPLDVLIVDDSKLIRKVLRQIIESDGYMRVVGEAADGRQAIALLSEVEPDVITLDINMPVMDGLTTLKHIMIKRPTPTVMISALTKEGALETFDSLKYGAIDFLPKPSQVRGSDLSAQKTEILRKIELAAAVQIESVRYLRRNSNNKKMSHESCSAFFDIIAIGVAEGGYGALLNVIPNLRNDMPASYIAVMHQEPRHVDGFARYLDQYSQLEVRRLTDGAVLQAGVCYLGAANEFVSLVRSGKHYRAEMKTPNSDSNGNIIDTMMTSVAVTMESDAVGVILTGAGIDGIDGLGKIIGKGGKAFVQDPVSSLFKKTPMTASQRYAIDYLVSDKQMAGAINAYLYSKCY